MKKQINLLPPKEQKENRLSLISNQLIRFGIYVSLSLLILFAVMFVTSTFLRKELSSAQEFVNNQLAEIDSLEDAKLKDEISILNGDLRDFKILQGAHRDFSPMLIELASLLSKDMILDSLEIDRSSGEIKASGRAVTRDSILEFRKRLIDSEYFTGVNFPLANLEDAFNASWEFTFFINKGKFDG